MKQEIDNNAMWAAFRQELALQGELQVVAAIDNALNNLGFTIEETSTIIPIPLKQGEQKSFARYKVGDTIYYDSFGRLVSFVIANIVEDGTDNPMYEDKDGNSVFQNDIVKQKSADKVEPKFKVGDWISGYYTNYKVMAVNSKGYVVEDTDGNKINILFENEKFHHLFTIADAKNGDVLSDGTTIFIFKDLLSDGSVMSYCDYDSDRCESDAFCPLSMNLICSKITPATKEQHDTLMKAMADAGYEWDSKKKELKKIIDEEQIKKNLQDNSFRRMFEQKPAPAFL